MASLIEQPAVPYFYDFIESTSDHRNDDDSVCAPPLPPIHRSSSTHGGTRAKSGLISWRIMFSDCHESISATSGVHVHRSARQTSHRVNTNYLSAVCGNYDQLNVESSSRGKTRRSEPTFRRRAPGISFEKVARVPREGETVTVSTDAPPPKVSISETFEKFTCSRIGTSFGAGFRLLL